MIAPIIAVLSGWYDRIPLRVKLYIGAAVIFAFAALRWRAAGIKTAMDEMKKKDEKRAQQIREKAAVARSNHPDGDVDIIERLRAHGRLRSDGHEYMHGTQGRSAQL